MDGRDAKLSLF